MWALGVPYGDTSGRAVKLTRHTEQAAQSRLRRAFLHHQSAALPTLRLKCQSSIFHAGHPAHACCPDMLGHAHKRDIQGIWRKNGDIPSANTGSSSVGLGPNADANATALTQDYEPDPLCSGSCMDPSRTGSLRWASVYFVCLACKTSFAVFFKLMFLLGGQDVLPVVLGYDSILEWIRHSKLSPFLV